MRRVFAKVEFSTTSPAELLQLRLKIFAVRWINVAVCWMQPVAQCGNAGARRLLLPVLKSNLWR